MQLCETKKNNAQHYAMHNMYLALFHANMNAKTFEAKQSVAQVAYYLLKVMRMPNGIVCNCYAESFEAWAAPVNPEVAPNNSQ